MDDGKTILFTTGQVSVGGSRVVVITGSSAGLGQALALCYSAPNTTLGLIGRNLERLESVASQCRALGAEAVVGCVDVRDSAGIQEWVSNFDERFPIDLLIANAGVASTLRSADDWEGVGLATAVIDTNLYGALHTVLPVIERMRSRRSGHIAVVSSLAALRGMAISPAYCASKAALMSYCDSIRPILARDDVALSVIMPGFIKTAMSDVFPANKPFMWSAQKAALHIQRKLARRDVEIAFPFPLAFGMKLLRLLPATIADAILGRLSYFPREGL
ncbi:SDR family NAD(P)-dependent oxidoreductase [Paraburkholderia fungorum]|uniref:SDR family NAD(P)-dependent oxidoreductase n=1 Tax=Paraburkholderia fungorum TaxID=134537 RepID=UPI0038BC859F